jgi:hypothetical protein
MAELTRLLSKSLSEVIRFSTSRNMYQSCLKSLGITKSSEVEETVHNHLKKWNLYANNRAEQSDVSSKPTSTTSHIV